MHRPTLTSHQPRPHRAAVAAIPLFIRIHEMDATAFAHTTPAFLSTFAPPNALRQAPPRNRCHHRRAARAVPLRPAWTMGTSMPEIPEVNLPEPAIPEKGDIAPELGTETAVVTVEESEADQQDSSSESTWLESILANRSPVADTDPLGYLRMTSEAVLFDSALPNRKQESWRFTDLRSVYASRYKPVEDKVNDTSSINEIDLQQYIPIRREDADAMLVFVNGKYRADLSYVSTSNSEHRFAGPIAEYPGDVNTLMFMWNRGELGDDHSIGAGFFPKVGNAVACDAAIVDVDMKLDRPIVACFITTHGDSPSAAVATAPRTAVLARPGSSFTLYECHVSVPMDMHHQHGDNNNNSNISSTDVSPPVAKRGNAGTRATILSGTALSVEQDAKVQHIFLNTTSNDSSFVGSVHATVGGAAGQYDLRVIGLGGMVGRLSAGIELDSEGSRASARGMLITDGYRTQDLHSRVRHNNKGTTFDQLQKNISSGRGRVVFSGQIIVTENCQATVSNQLSNSLLLSEQASVDAMPVLEIANDDVECTHGATVSDLSEDELFYMRSRGLTHVEAQGLLTLGFAKAVFMDCENDRLTDLVRQKLDLISAMSKARATDETTYLTI